MSMSLTRNILTTFATRLTMVALALLSSVVLARLLGPDGRGVFALIVLLPELAASFALFGMDQANLVYAGLEPENRRKLVWHSVLIAGVLGGVIAVAGIAFFMLRVPGSRTLVHGPLWLYVLPLAVLPMSLVFTYWGAIIRGINCIALLNAIQVGTKVVSLMLVVGFVGLLRLDIAGAVWADAIITVGGVGVMVFLLRRLKLWGRPSFDWPLCKRMARFALPAYLSDMMSYLNYRVDQFIIAILLPPEQMAYYVIAVGLAERLWLLTGAVAGPLLPHLTNSSRRDPAVAAVISRHVLVWTGAACTIVFIFADVLVRLLYSSEFSPTVAPLRWLLPGILTLTVGKVLVAELLARKKVVYMLWVSILAAVLNIVGNLAFVPSMGISGAALASSISYTVVSALVTWFYIKETGLPWSTILPRVSDLQVYMLLSRRAVQLALACTARVQKVQP